jgi:hypothetical protein
MYCAVRECKESTKAECTREFWRFTASMRLGRSDRNTEYEYRPTASSIENLGIINIRWLSILFTGGWAAWKVIVCWHPTPSWYCNVQRLAAGGSSTSVDRFIYADTGFLLTIAMANWALFGYDTLAAAGDSCWTGSCDTSPCQSLPSPPGFVSRGS